MSFYHFPSDFVYWDEVKNHDEIKKQLLPTILKKVEENINNPFVTSLFKTSYYMDERLETENIFLYDKNLVETIIFEPLTKMIEKYNGLGMHQIKLGFSVLRGAWWNMYEENHYQEHHDHSSPPLNINGNTLYPSLSMIYILHDENEKSGVVFKKYAPQPLVPPFAEHTFQTSKHEDIKEGTVLIFPSGLGHLVKPCIKPGRITIAYNLFSTY